MAARPDGASLANVDQRQIRLRAAAPRVVENADRHAAGADALDESRLNYSSWLTIRAVSCAMSARDVYLVRRMIWFCSAWKAGPTSASVCAK